MTPSLSQQETGLQAEHEQKETRNCVWSVRTERHPKMNTVIYTVQDVTAGPEKQKAEDEASNESPWQ